MLSMTKNPMVKEHMFTSAKLQNILIIIILSHLGVFNSQYMQVILFSLPTVKVD